MSPEAVLEAPNPVDLELEKENATEAFSQTLEQGRREGKANLIASSAAMMEFMGEDTSLTAEDKEKISARLTEIRADKNPANAIRNKNSFHDLVSSMAILGEKPKLTAQEVADLQAEYSKESSGRAAAILEMLNLPFPPNSPNKYKGDSAIAQNIEEQLRTGRVMVGDLNRATYAKLAGANINISEDTRNNVLKGIQIDKQYDTSGFDVAKKIAYLTFLERNQN